MGNPIKILPHYTYEDYIHWEGKWEIIDGVPYAMSPAPVPKHQIISTRLIVAFSNQLTQCEKCIVLQPVDYLVSDDIILQPDILIVCKPIEKKFLDFPPVLVVEVLSPSTALKDRHSKYEIYQSQGVKYYILVDPDKNEAEVFELNSGEYKMTAKGKDFSHSFLFEDCNAAIEFKEIWK
jgi:Uma2 family endonuclease